MGWPITHSLSPRLHGFWLRAHGLDGSYTALPVKPDELHDALRALPPNGFRGVNLTVPLKEAACAIVDDMDDTTRRIGAINLVTVGTDGKLFGRNTDAFGFAQNLLSSGFSTRGRAACVLGAGGAARAVLTDRKSVV
jgi:shikimate dehydrogenase